MARASSPKHRKGLTSSHATWTGSAPPEVLLLLRQDFCLPSYSTKAPRSQTKALIAGKEQKQRRQLISASKAMSGGVQSSAWPHPHSSSSSMSTTGFSANAETGNILQTNIPQGRKKPKMYQVIPYGITTFTPGVMALAYF